MLRLTASGIWFFEDVVEGSVVEERPSYARDSLPVWHNNDRLPVWHNIDIVNVNRMAFDRPVSTVNLQSRNLNTTYVPPDDLQITNRSSLCVLYVRLNAS